MNDKRICYFLGIYSFLTYLSARTDRFFLKQNQNNNNKQNTMYDNYNYPLGADNENAPWNEKENKVKEFMCEATVILTKRLNVATQNYIEEEPEYPDFMGAIDTTDVDWEEEYANQHFEFTEMLTKMRSLLRKWQPSDLSFNEKRELEELLDDASNWELYEIQVQKDD